MLVVLLKKQIYDTKVTEIENKLNNHNHDKYITTPEFDTLAADDKLSSFNRKITENKTKHLLVQNYLNKLKTFASSYFRGKSPFEEDGEQNHLIFQQIVRYFKVNTIINITDYILS